MTPDLRTIPQVLDRIADQFSDHDALVTDDRQLTYAQLRTEVRQAAAAMIDLGVQRRGPGRDLVAEHLALGGGVPGHALRRRRGGAAEHSVHRQ